MRIACYQPEIAGNMGAVLRLAACFGIDVDVIEPCGFVFSDARMRRAGMDYAQHVALVRHAAWDEFAAAAPDIAAACHASVRIPIAAPVRSLNIAVAAGIALSEALRQTGGLPE